MKKFRCFIFIGVKHRYLYALYSCSRVRHTWYTCQSTHLYQYLCWKKLGLYFFMSSCFCPAEQYHEAWGTCHLLETIVRLPPPGILLFWIILAASRVSTGLIWPKCCLYETGMKSPLARGQTRSCVAPFLALVPWLLTVEDNPRDARKAVHFQPLRNTKLFIFLFRSPFLHLTLLLELNRVWPRSTF